MMSLPDIIAVRGTTHALGEQGNWLSKVFGVGGKVYAGLEKSGFFIQY